MKRSPRDKSETAYLSPKAVEDGDGGNRTHGTFPPSSEDATARTRRNLEVLADALAAPSTRQLQADTTSPGKHEPSTCEWCKTNPPTTTTWCGGLRLQVCAVCRIKFEEWEA